LRSHGIGRAEGAPLCHGVAGAGDRKRVRAGRQGNLDHWLPDSRRVPTAFGAAAAGAHSLQGGQAKKGGVARVDSQRQARGLDEAHRVE